MSGKCSQVEIWDAFGAYLIYSLSQASQPCSVFHQCLKSITSCIFLSCMIFFIVGGVSLIMITTLTQNGKFLPKEFSGNLHKPISKFV